MKTLKQIIFTFVAVAGLSVAVSAQKQDPKKPPPKDPPPVVNPGKPKKPPPKETPTPRDQDKPKKPGMAFFVYSRERHTDLG